jgi:S1-C subfamily serine protease
MGTLDFKQRACGVGGWLLAGLVVAVTCGFASEAAADAGGRLEGLRRIGRELGQIAEGAYPGVAALRVERAGAAEALRDSLRRRSSRGDRVRPDVPEVEVRRPQRYRFSDPEALPELYSERDLRQELRGFMTPEELRERLRRGRFGEAGQGLGIIVSAEGHIVTNYHIVRDANRVEVKLTDGRSYAGKIVGVDKATDIAVVKIEATDLEPLAFGDSDRLALGDWVIGIGNPMGIGRTFRMGMVTGKHRQRLGMADYEDFLQTDAVPSLGDGGGPLLDLEGKVVGMNTAVLGADRGAAIGLAIPAKMVQAVYEEIVESGGVARGYLGIALSDIDAQKARALDEEAGMGVLVASVVDDSPAARAGFETGDIIVTLEGEAVTSSWQLRNGVAGLKPGRKVEIVVLRDGARKELRVALGERPSRR